MTRRNLVILFVLLGAALIFWQSALRKPKEQISVVPPSRPLTTSSESSQPGQKGAPASNTNKPDRETAVAEMPSREVRMPRVQVRENTPETRNAQVTEVTLLADTSWKVWTGVTAVLKKDGRPQENMKGEVNGYYLIEDGVNRSSTQFYANRPLVVIDTRLDTVGVLTGVFAVVLKKGVSADVLAQVPEIKIVNEFPQINTYYVTASKEPFDLLALKEFLRSEPGVADVQPEILSRQYEKY